METHSIDAIVVAGELSSVQTRLSFSLPQLGFSMSHFVRISECLL